MAANVLLRPQLEEANDRARALSTEVSTLREEAAKLKAALASRGEAGQLLKELTVVKDERVRLALELHEAKSIAAKAREESADAWQALRAVDQLRDSLAESSAGMAAARAEVERLTSERHATLTEHGELLEQAQGMAEELDKLRASHKQLQEQKLALIERLDAMEKSLALLRDELQKRETAFATDLNLFAQRDAQQRAAIDEHHSNAAAAAKRMEGLAANLDEARSHNSELILEVEKLHRNVEERSARLERVEAAAREMGARAEAAEAVLLRERHAKTNLAQESEMKQQLIGRRLEECLKELQETVDERDRLNVTLEEALSRCTSSLVAKTLAEDESHVLHQQLDDLRTRAVS